MNECANWIIHCHQLPELLYCPCELYVRSVHRVPSPLRSEDTLLYIQRAYRQLSYGAYRSRLEASVQIFTEVQDAVISRFRSQRGTD